jgi:hypothetical protein
VEVQMDEIGVMHRILFHHRGTENVKNQDSLNGA